jgi:hypothetical protein
VVLAELVYSAEELSFLDRPLKVVFLEDQMAPQHLEADPGFVTAMLEVTTLAQACHVAYQSLEVGEALSAPFCTAQAHRGANLKKLAPTKTHWMKADVWKESLVWSALRLRDGGMAFVPRLFAASLAGKVLMVYPARGLS